MIFKVILVSVTFAVYCEAQFEGDKCVKDGSEGVCLNLQQCETALKELQSRKNPQICSFDDKSPIVCCVTSQPASPPSPPEEEYDEEEGCDSLEASITPLKTGQKAFDKCIEYQEKYVYPCEQSSSLLGDLGRSNHCHHETDDLIIGGTDAAQYEFPHMALVGYGNLDDIKYQCGGAIISERYILTAGHCIESVDFGPLTYVAIGALKRSEAADPSKIYKVRNVIKHPQYKPPSKYNDIALIETERQMELNQFTVPACLHIGDVVNDTRVLAAGWGLTHNVKNAVLSENLKKVILNKFSTKECSEKYGPFRLMKRGFEDLTQTCYGDKEPAQLYQGREESKDTCQGDSGGPIKIKDQKIHCMYTVVGVTSLGKGCGLGDKPGIYTKVAHFVPWIEGIVWPN